MERGYDAPCTERQTDWTPVGIRSVSAPSTGSAGRRATGALVSATPQETSTEPIPTGTVTFVFTDIEGSTERWDRERHAMQAAVRRHDEIVRSAIVDRGGYVFKTMGDAFCAAFARPEDAVAAILAAQRAIASEGFSANSSDTGGR